MLLTVKKKIEETIDIRLPAYFKGFLDYNRWCIAENGCIIQVSLTMISVYKPGTVAYDTTLSEIGMSDTITPDEFEDTYDRAMSAILEAHESNFLKTFHHV